MIAACLALSGLGAAVVRGGDEGAVVRACLDPGSWEKRLLILFAVGGRCCLPLVSAAPARREEERSPRCHLSSRGGLLARWHDGKGKNRSTHPPCPTETETETETAIVADMEIVGGDNTMGVEVETTTGAGDTDAVMRGTETATDTEAIVTEAVVAAAVVSAAVEVVAGG